MGYLERLDFLVRIGVYVSGGVTDKPQGFAWVAHGATPARAHDLVILVPMLMSGDWPVSSAPLIGPELLHCDCGERARLSSIERYIRIRSLKHTPARLSIFHCTVPPHSCDRALLKLNSMAP